MFTPEQKGIALGIVLTEGFTFIREGEEHPEGKVKVKTIP